jgi:DNA-binding NarL/FixJ family response regulator
MTVHQKILCIEDDPQTVELLVEVLEEEGLAPIVARDGREGMAKLGERPGLVLCDIDMPHKSGFDVLRDLRQSGSELRSIPFIFITAYGNRDVHLQARRLGCDDFLEKPIDFELLLAIVRNYLAQRGTPEHAEFTLTARELEAMTWVARGKSSADIAVLLNVSERTINFHINNVVHKAGVSTRVQAALRCARLGLIDV